VTDRTYLDNLTYCALHMAEHLERGACDIYIAAMSRYDLVLWLPKCVFQDLGDGVRKTSLEYHTVYEAVLWGFIQAGTHLTVLNDDDLYRSLSPAVKMVRSIKTLADRNERAFSCITEICG
jgi:hypothetical protein